jgi:hypothetical protein
LFFIILKIMGATKAIGTGLSVVGGLVSLNQKNKQAKAQQKLLSQQERQQKLQADLQLFALKQQSMLNNLQDALQDAAAKQAFLATDTQLQLQQLTNKAAASNAILAAQIEGVKQELQSTAQELSAEEQRQQAKAAARNELVAATNQETERQAQLINQILAAAKNNEEQRNSLLTILDAAAAQGGINEALSLLLDANEPTADKNKFAFNREQSRAQSSLEAAQNKTQLTEQLANLASSMGLIGTNLQRTQSTFTTNNQIRDAEVAKAVANLALEGQRLANQTNYHSSLLASDMQRKSRYLQQQVNEEALKLGQALSSSTLEAQKQMIQKPGFFDYAGLALGAYNLYDALSKNKQQTK